MRVPNNLARGGVAFNTTPMIDVVFLLIIFFLVSSHLAQQERVKVDLPKAVSGEQSEEGKTRRVVVNVLLDKQHNRLIQVAGQEVDHQQLEALIEDEYNEANRRRTDLEVRIRTDYRIPYEFIEPIMVACANARVWKVTFAVTQQNRT